MTDVKRLERQLFRQMRQTCEDHALLAPGDRVMVALSGGKDSYTLAHLLPKLQRAMGIELELVCVHLDQRQPGYDGVPLARWLRESGMRFEILSEDTYSVVTSQLGPESTYCSLCSRLRRGILYEAAGRLGCNKVALGHHRDDALETFLLNLFYSGKLQAMPARYQTDDGRFTVIRPMIECGEETIAKFAAGTGFPIIPCNLCGSQEGLQREAMTQLLNTLERDNPHVRAVMLNALRNVRPTHLLDREVSEAWAARPAHIRPQTHNAEPAKPLRHAALPVESDALGPRRLPVIS